MEKRSTAPRADTDAYAPIPNLSEDTRSVSYRSCKAANCCILAFFFADPVVCTVGATLDKSFSESRNGTLLSATIAGALGIFLLIAYAWLLSSNPTLSLDGGAKSFFAQLLLAFGSAGVSVSVALVVTDVILKPGFTRELFRIANLSERLKTTGIRELGLSDRVDWNGRMTTSSEVKMVVAQPDLWRANHLDQLLARAKRNTKTELYVTNPTGPGSPVAAARFGYEEAFYSEQVSEFVDICRERWLNLPNRHLHASLTIYYMGEAPTSTMFQFDTVSVFGIPNKLSDKAPSILYLELGHSDSDVNNWAESKWQELSRIREAAPAWSSPAIRISESDLREELGALPVPSGGN